MATAITPSPEYTRRALLAKLGVTEESLAACVRISPELGRITRAIKSANSNLPRDPFYYLAASDAPEARAILAARERISRGNRKLVPIEAFCIAAAVPPMRVLEVITATAVRLGAQASAIIAAVAHPKVVEKTVEMALTDEGIEDRTTLHKHTGFLPMPKGSQTIIHNVANASASAPTVIAAPPPERTIKTLVDRFNERRGVLAASPILELAAPAPTDSILDHSAMPAREIEMVDIVDPEDES